MSTHDISPFKRFLSDYRFPICSIYEEKNCDAASNDTRRNHKLDNNVRQSAESATKDIVDYKSAVFLENIEVENDTIPSSQEDLAVPFPSEQPPIVTFDEWTKEKLKKEEIRRAEQQQNQQYKATVHSDASETSKLGSSSVPASKTVKKVTRLAPPNIISQEATARNYASKECGAKVLFSNAEAENKNAILNEKEADDYVRNPCEQAEHKWLIIELCETIQPTVLEIANFELFSSGPQNIKILGSERYPSNEWIALGDFVVENNREIQRFPIAARSYVKFFRLELLSHYGHEHYCTLSLVRVLGISMVDEYEAEAEAASLSDTTFSVPIEVQAANSSAAETMDTSIVTPVNTAKENESVDDLPFVNAVVNAVGNTVGSIGNIKGVIESTFLSKSAGTTLRNITRNNATVVELCTKCFRDVVHSYVLFCRAFFGFQYSLIRTDHAEKTKNMQVPMHSSFKNQKKNQTRGQQFFFASVFSTYYCDLESKILENFENVQNSTSYHAVEPDVISTIPPTVDSPTISKNLGGGFMIPGGVLSHKESIFLKLNKRISNLELNMSLSSEYLSELSRRYVLQTNESRRQAELIIKQAEEAAVNAVRPSINALKIQMDALAASLRELTEAIKGLSQEVSPADHTMILKSVESRSNDADASLAHSQAHLYGYLTVWTTGELVCIVVFVNVLTLLILLLLHYGSAIISRRAAEQVMDDQIHEFIHKSSDIRSTGTNESATADAYHKQQLIPEASSAFCGVVDVTQAEEVWSSSLVPANEICLPTKNETKDENYKSQSVELVYRPSSQLSTHSEQNLWQTKKKKNKKRTRIRKSEDLDEPLYGFKILANLGIE